MDRMSDLPDDIIHSIVSFLSAKDAACVQVLAKRFRNLFTIIKDLVLDAMEIPGIQGRFTGHLYGVIIQQQSDIEKIPGINGRFTDHVYGAMGQLESGTRIKRFTLNCLWRLGPDHVNDWVRNVLKRGIMDLELSMYANGEYTLPREIFNCNTLVRLELGTEFVIRDVPTNASLPALEILHVNAVQFQAIGDDVGDCALKGFLLACPVLIELMINGFEWETWRWAGIFSIPSLQRLTLDRGYPLEFDGPAYQGITFETPRLTYFKYIDFVADAYPIVDFDSLVHAELSLTVVANQQFRGQFADVDDPISSNPTNLINGIRNVQILELSTPASFNMLYLFREAIPVFENLHCLTIGNEEGWGMCWQFLPFLLNKTPNLKTLIIEYALHYAGRPDYVCECVSRYDCLLSCPVEVLDVTLSMHRTKRQFEQLKHFLRKLPRLVLLNVRSDRVISDRRQSDLQMLASPTCQVNFI